MWRRKSAVISQQCMCARVTASSGATYWPCSAAAELTAQVGQARAAYQSALADRNNVYAGVRSEEIAISAAEVDKAKSRLTYADQQLGRFSRLVRDNFAPRQSLDQAKKNAATALADVAEASANYASAKAGATWQERAISDASVAAAAAQVAVLESRLRKTVLNAPTDGVVRVVAAEIGEAVRAGQTIITIEDAGQPWLSFNAREDRLMGITVGSTVEVKAGARARTVAGLGDGSISHRSVCDVASGTCGRRS